MSISKLPRKLVIVVLACAGCTPCGHCHDDYFDHSGPVYYVGYFPIDDPITAMQVGSIAASTCVMNAAAVPSEKRVYISTNYPEEAKCLTDVLRKGGANITYSDQEPGSGRITPSTSPTSPATSVSK